MLTDLITINGHNCLTVFTTPAAGDVYFFSASFSVWTHEKKVCVYARLSTMSPLLKHMFPRLLQATIDRNGYISLESSVLPPPARPFRNEQPFWSSECVSLALSLNLNPHTRT